MRKLEPGAAPWKDYLGVLGSASLTAYAGLKLIGEPRGGETLYVSAASGAVGSIAAQIGKIMGCRVVGSAGTDDKVAWLKDELCLDAAFNYRTAKSMDAALAEHCAEGIDIDFENVGGETLQAALDHIRPHGRIIMCGAISEVQRAWLRPEAHFPHRQPQSADAGLHRFGACRHDACLHRRHGRLAQGRQDQVSRDDRRGH